MTTKTSILTIGELYTLNRLRWLISKDRNLLENPPHDLIKMLDFGETLLNRLIDGLNFIQDMEKTREFVFNATRIDNMDLVLQLSNHIDAKELKQSIHTQFEPFHLHLQIIKTTRQIYSGNLTDQYAFLGVLIKAFLQLQ